MPIHIDRFWDRLNLMVRLLLAVVLSMTIAMLGLAYQSARDNAIYIQSDLASGYQQEMDRLESMVASALIIDTTDPDPDPVNLRVVLEGIRHGPEVVHVGFRDTSDLVSFSHDTPLPLQTPLWFARWCGLEEINANRAVVIEGQYYGVLTLIISPNYAINQVWARYLKKMQMLCLCFVLVWGIMCWVLRQGLFPLKALATANEALGRGDLSVRLEVIGSPELRMALSNFNRMALKIEADRNALRVSEQRFRALIEQAPDAIVVYDLDLDRFVDANASAEKLFGCSREELLQGDPQRFCPPMHPDPLAIGKNFFGQTENTLSRENDVFERSIHSADGRNLLCEVRMVTLPEENHRLIRASFIDITERRRAEEKIKVQAQIAANMAEGVYLIRLSDGIIIYTNPKFEEMFGYAPGEMLWKHVSIVNPPSTITTKTPEQTAHEIMATLREVKKWIGEIQNVKKDGTLFWSYATVSVFEHPVDGPVLVAVHTDITEKKRLEEEQKKLQAQLNQVQRMESVGALAGGVAHDYNNMLGVILGYTDLALEKLDPSQSLHDDLQEIRIAAERSTEVTRQLLAFARKQTIAPRVIDLNETVEGMLKMLRRLIGEDIDLAWLPESGLWPVNMDPSQIDQMIANLCINARDAIAGVGKITIETGTDSFDEVFCAENDGFIPGEYVRLAFSDNGCGMDKETQCKIFEPFFTTKGVGQGTGLGLATVYGIVKQNEGFIIVYSEPGQGTTFRIYLPSHKGTTEQVQQKDSSKSAIRGDETVLLVEDEPAILKMATKMLKSLGYTVLAAATPIEAISLAQTHPDEIRLLVTDVVMPEMNGRDLAARLMPHYPDIKCLFMSGYTANVIAHRGALDEGLNFIQKPFSKEDLATKLRETLDQT